MTERKKRNSKNANTGRQLTGITAVIATIVFAVYGASVFVGGAFHDFCENAIIWVIMGIGAAAWFAYYAQKDGTSEKEPDSGK
jgi:hypothetical protein